VFLFDGEGDLLAISVDKREQLAVQSRYSVGGQQLTPVSLLKEALKDLGASSDKNNVPMSEDEANRLAWLGVEMQALTPELARANGVSDQTKDGRLGGLVTYVYPNSPAAKAGVEVGWVLLRVDVEGQPKPIDVEVESDMFADEPFPWDRLDELPEQVFDRIPTPWPNPETTLVRSLTDMGFGKNFIAEFAHDAKVEMKEFSVTQGPATFNSASKYKSAGLGITVRDLTYEVRRYMQKKDNDPGVIIGKIEMGSKASIAGLKPFEVITHVNDQPVLNVKDFENATKDLTELRLSIKRMATGRIVKITLPKADSAATEEAK
jgi:serine protease Do